ncbi:MAG: HlyD family efflux transporter periplasmic adaptor subunit [Pseudomonadales bacterium]|nr:HlyD family efflux transporter periplasmic adaptor subunit [Pseudomonadales bacterium]
MSLVLKRADARKEQLRIESELVSLTNDMRETSIELKQLDAEFNTERLLIQTQINEQEQDLRELSSVSDVGVFAPQDAFVGDLYIAMSEFVPKGEPLLSLLPEGGKYQIELFIPSRSMGSVREGQEIKLSFDAYPPESHGVAMAKVFSVAKATLPFQKSKELGLSASELVYSVKAEIESLPLVRTAQREMHVELVPDLTVTARIILQENSVFSWMQNQLNAQRDIL